MGTFSYRRQSDLRARRFPPVGSIGDLATITSYRIGANRSTRRSVAAMVQQHPMKVSNLDSVLKNLASFKFPTSNPASPPAPQPAAVQGARSAGAMPSWMKKSGYRENSDD